MNLTRLKLFALLLPMLILAGYCVYIKQSDSFFCELNQEVIYLNESNERIIFSESIETGYIFYKFYTPNFSPEVAELSARIVRSNRMFDIQGLGSIQYDLFAESWDSLSGRCAVSSIMEATILSDIKRIRCEDSRDRSEREFYWTKGKGIEKITFKRSGHISTFLLLSPFGLGRIC